MAGDLPPDRILGMELTPALAGHLLKRIAADSGRVFFTVHANAQMHKRHITPQQVLTCLRHGRIIEGPARSLKGNWEFAVEAVAAGELIHVPAAFDEDAHGTLIIVISAYFK